MEEDQSEIVIEDSIDPANPAQIKLTMRQPYNMPDKYAVFNFGLPGFVGELPRIKEGESFALPNQPDDKFTLESVEDSLAKISLSGSDGNPKIVEITP